MKSFFKKFKKKIPVTSSKSSSYFVRENVFEELRDLKKILKIGLEPPFSVTEKEITFHGVPLSTTTQQVIKKKFGNPFYVLDNSEVIAGHTVFFYKDSIATYKFLIQYHFIDNIFFFASNKVSSIRVLSEKDKEKVIKRIKVKYFGDDAEEIKGLLVKVKDPNNSVLFTLDDVYYHLNYLLNNKTTKSLVEKYMDYEEPVILPKGFSDSLNEYI
jgi:hypothetical protein